MNGNHTANLEASAPAIARSTFWGETWSTLFLAVPIIFGQVLQNALGVIDTLMVGKVSVIAVAAASLSTAVFFVPLVFGFGVLGPFSVFVAGAIARREDSEAIHYLRRGLALAGVLGIILALFITALSGELGMLGQPPAVVAQARPFLLLLTWSVVPMYLFQVLKQYCESLRTAWPPMLILSGGLLLNVGLNWIFIFGHLGAPALGLLGAGWSTFISRTLVLATMAVVVLRLHFKSGSARRHLWHGAFRWTGYRDLLRLGLPAGFQFVLEVGAFTFAAIMMGWISATALAAHQISISIASLTFMVPMGLATAVSIRVSHAIQSKDARRARQCAAGSLLLGVGFMGVTAVIICAFPAGLAGLFIRDASVVALASHLLIIAGLFQIFDGSQVLCGGALRGVHDVRWPTFINFCAYWLIGLPISFLLAFKFHLGAMGVWWGLLIALVLLGTLLALRLKAKLFR